MMLSGRIFARYLGRWLNLPFPSKAAMPSLPSPLGKVAECSEAG